MSQIIENHGGEHMMSQIYERERTVENWPSL